MSQLTLSQINAAVDAAFATVLAQTPPQRVASAAIGDNAALRVDTYTSPKGAGLAVVATVDLKFRKLIIVRQHGPESFREQLAPELADLLEQCRAARAKRYDAEASVYDLADAETKLASADASEQESGAAQKTAVLIKRLQIKAEIPKPQ